MLLPGRSSGEVWVSGHLDPVWVDLVDCELTTAISKKLHYFPRVYLFLLYKNLFPRLYFDSEVFRDFSPQQWLRSALQLTGMIGTDGKSATI
jgi:hypothetical protein